MVSERSGSWPGGVERVTGGYLIPRNSLLLLMVAQAVVVLPHISHLSLWVVAVGVVCGWWRWMLFRGALGYPSRWVKAVLVLAGAVGIGFSGGALFSLESATGLLIVAFALKLVEMRSRRDAYVVIFLSYFIIATKFLFDQSIGVAAYQLLAAVLVTAAMVGLNQLHSRVRVVSAVRLASALLLQAVPLTLVLFIFFPRVAPLWSVPMPGGSTTGLDDEVRAGDVARLSRSDEIAFRVVFDGPVPVPEQLYWRGLVYSEYESGTWRQSRGERGGTEPLPNPEWPPAAVPTDDPEQGRGALAYQVFMEPTQARWLFGVDLAMPRSDGIELTQDFRLLADDRVTSLKRYRVESFPDVALGRELPDWLRRRELQLPAGDNPRLQAFARAMHAEAGSDEAYVDAVLEHIRTEPFHYTLEPPMLPDQDGIDKFWFETRSGFCTHYAGALVHLMRAVDIPARMVGGYQGGEINRRTGHLVLRQYDAHAWAEVWLQGRGWVRVDPTAAVAPNRIDQGLNAALSDEDRASLSMLAGARMGRDSLVADLLGLFESLEHRWNLRVLGYDADLQAGYLKRLLGEVTPARIALAMLIGGGASVALVALSLFWRRGSAPRDPVVLAVGRFSRRLRGIGMERRASETPAAYFVRLNENTAGLPASAELVSAEIETALYDPGVPAPDLTALRRNLRRLRLHLLLRAPS